MCLLVGLFIGSLVRSLRLLWFLTKYKSAFHGIQHRCSAFAPNVATSFGEANVNIQDRFENNPPAAAMTKRKH